MFTIKKTFSTDYMAYHFIRHKPSGGLLTVIDNRAIPMYMCFKSIHCAEHCKKHFAVFKSRYGVWPTINLSHGTEVTVHTPLKTKKSTFEETYDKMIIDIIHEDDLIKLGNVTGASFMYCHEFGIIHDGTDRLNVAFSGQEITVDTDYDEYIKTLEECIVR